MKCKWRSLRDTFNKEYKKIPNSRSGSSAEDAPIYKGKWVYFNAMSFIKDVFTPRETESNISYQDIDETFAESTEDVETQMSNEPSSPSVLAGVTSKRQSDEFTRAKDLMCVTPDSVRPPKKKSKVTTNLSEFEKQLLQTERDKIKLLEETEDDDDIHFFKSLLPYFKKMNPLQKLKVRTKIQEVVINELTIWPTTSPVQHSGESSTGSGFQTYNFGPAFNENY